MFGSGLWRPALMILLLLPFAIAAMPGWASAADAPPMASCPVGGYAAVSCPIVNDALIAKVVRSRIGGLSRPPYVVQVKVADRVIYLSGYAISQTQKDAAGILASTARGARCIHNSILVRPPADSDMAILAGVMRALSHSTYNVHMVRAMVTNGIVTLTGLVEDEETRSMIVMIPQSVNGVREVVNELIVRERWSN